MSAQSPPGAVRETAPLRVAVYTDYAYHQVGGEVRSERAFSFFLARLSLEAERLVVAGRLDPEPARARYPLGDRVEFVALPHYRSLTHPWEAIRGMAGSLRRWWRALDGVDSVWLLGPHPLAPAFALIARIRGRRVALGVRQDTPAYLRSRHPGRRLIAAIGWALDKSYSLMARRFPVVVVGPELAKNYAAAPDLLEITVSLIGENQIEAGPAAEARDYGGELTVLSVGRLDAEKNPTMLADLLQLLRNRDPRWRLVVCGEGPMASDLAERLGELGVGEYAELRGYVPLDGGLLDAYRASHALIHSSWTEGLPQILFEAFACGLPVVATDVGGIRQTVGSAVRLIAPGDPEAAARKLGEVAGDPELRDQMVTEGERLVRAHTIDKETRGVAAFLAAAGKPNG